MKPLRRVAFVVNPEKPGAADLARELMAIAPRARRPPEAHDAILPPARVLAGLRRLRRHRGRRHPPWRRHRGGAGPGADHRRQSRQPRLPHHLFPRRGPHPLRRGAAGRIPGRLPRDAWARASGSAPADLALNDVLIKRRIDLAPGAAGGLRRRRIGDRLPLRRADFFDSDRVDGLQSLRRRPHHPPVFPGDRDDSHLPAYAEQPDRHFPGGGPAGGHQPHGQGTRLLVALDGQRNRKTDASSPIRISVPSRRLPLAQQRNYSPFSVVRTKLNWSGGVIEKRDPSSLREAAARGGKPARRRGPGRH